MLLTDRSLHDAHAEVARALWGEVWVSWDGPVPAAEARLTGGGRVWLRQEPTGWSVRVANTDERWVLAALAHAFGGAEDPGPPSWIDPVGADLVGWTNGQTYAGAWWAKAGSGGRGTDLERVAAFVEDELPEHLPESGPWVELHRASWEEVDGGWAAAPEVSEPLVHLVLDAWRQRFPEVRAVRSEEGTALLTDDLVLLVFRA